MANNLAKKVLQNADFDQENGLLGFSLAELQDASIRTTSAVQNYIAGKIRGKFDARYQQYVSNYPQEANSVFNQARNFGNEENPPMSYEEFYSRNRSAYFDVMAQDLDLSLEGLMVSPNGGDTTGKRVKRSFRERTVGGWMNYLATTELPGVLTAFAKPVYGEAPIKRDAAGQPILDARGRAIPTGEPAPLLGRQASNLPLDDIQAGFLSGYESIYRFDPKSTAGKDNNFTVWFQNSVKKGIDDFRSWERGIRSGSIPMSLAMGDGDDTDEGGNFVDRNSGEWLDPAANPEDMFGEVGNASRFRSLPVQPDANAFGIDWSVPGGKRNTLNDFIRSKMDVKGDFFDTFNVMNRQYGQGNGADTLQVLGIDPESPAGKAGMVSGAFLMGVRSLFRDERIYNVLDAFENGATIELPGLDENLNERIYSIQSPGFRPGNGFSDLEQDPEKHWLDALADQVEGKYSNAMVTLGGGQKRNPDGTWTTYTTSKVSAKGQSAAIPTSLFTTEERFASGVWKDSKGDWRVAPVVYGPDAEHQVPVQFTPDTFRRFAGIYNEYSKSWAAYDRTYKEEWQTAYNITFDQYRKANLAGKPIEKPFLDQVRDVTLNRLPRNVPRPGQLLFNRWQAGSKILSEIREFEKTIGPIASSGSDFWERSIEEWDAWASSQEQYKNAGVYGYVSPQRLAMARAEVSGAGNYLAAERQARAAGVLDRVARSSVYGGGNDLPSRLLAVNENGEIARRYPEMIGAEYKRGEMWTPYDQYLTGQALRGGSPITSANPTLDPTPVKPGWGAKEHDGLLPRGFGFETIRVRGQADERRGMYPNASGRTTRMLEELSERRRVGTPSPGYGLGAPEIRPGPSQILPARPGKYKEQVRPWYQPPGANEMSSPLDPNFSLTRMAGEEGYAVRLFSDRFSADQGELELAAYSQISNRNALSAFPQGSMNEDDWVDREGKRNSEPVIRGENTYDGSIMGGDVNTEAFDAENEAIDWNAVYDINTREPINGEALLPFKPHRKYSYSASAEWANSEANNTDPLIAHRRNIDPEDLSDPELESVSDVISQRQSSANFDRALSVLDDPKAKDAPLAAVVSSAGNEGGFLEHSKVDWSKVLGDFSHSEKTEGDNASFATYWGLENAHGQIKDMAQELDANLTHFKTSGRKKDFITTRFGENPVGWREQFNARNSRRAQYFREPLRQISEQYKLNLSYRIGDEAKLFDQIVALSKNPDQREAYGAIKSLFAPLADQLNVSRALLDSGSSRNTPRPARGQEPGDSHVFKGPDGKGKAVLKYSPNQEYEMRRGRGMVDPVTGALDLNAFENTSMPLQVAARGGGGGGHQPLVNGFSIPDYKELNALQNSIAYEHFENRGGDHQQDRFGGQVQTYKDKYMARRKRFDVIMPYNAAGDTDGMGLESLIRQADNAVRGAFGAGFDISDMAERADPDLAPGYIRLGAFVKKAGEAPDYSNEWADQQNVGEPPEAPPDDFAAAPPAGGSGDNGNGSQPPQEPPAPPPPDPQTPQPQNSGSNTPRPRNNGRPTPAPKPPVNTDPAHFPMQPGAVGWKMQFSRWDKAANGGQGGGRQITAWARDDGQGNIGWYEKNEQGEMEPMRINKGWGKVYNEQGQLLHNVSRADRDYYDNIVAAPLAQQVSSAGNPDPNAPNAGGPTPAPARPDVVNTPEGWEQIQPQAGYQIEDRRGGSFNKRFLYAQKDPDNAGQWKWYTSAKGGVAQEASNPGWGIMRDNDGNVIADVKEDRYEAWANEQGIPRAQAAASQRKIDEAAHAAEAAQRRMERQAAVATPPPARSGFSAMFGRFSNSMWEISGRWQSRFLQAHSPSEFGEDQLGHNTTLAMNNEYLAQATHIYNQFVDSPPQSAQEVFDTIMDMTGAEESQVRPIADALYSDFADAKRNHRQLKKENPMRRSMQRAARLDEALTADPHRGPEGMRSFVQNYANDVSINDIDGFKSPSLGRPDYFTFTDSSGSTRWAPRLQIEKTNPVTGETGMLQTADQTQISKGMGWAKNAFNTAMSGELPASPDGILATLKERMYKAMSQQMRTEVDEAVAHGQNRTEAGIAANVTKEIGDHFVQQIVKKVQKALGETVGEASGSAVAEGTRYDTRIKSVEDLQAKMASDPVFAAEFKGRSAEDIHAGDEMVVYDGNERSVMVGGSGKSRYDRIGVSSDGNSGPGGTNGPGKMFGQGKWGSLFYGAYLLKREWQMAAAPTIQAAEKYGEGMADYTGLLYTGQNMSEGVTGFAYRQQAGEEFMGRAAYSSWGALMDIPYRLSQSGNLSAARLVQNAGIAGGLAMGGAITGSMLSMGGMAAAGGALAAGGMWAAGGLLAATGGMEIYNSFFKPEDALDLTFSSVVEDAQRESARWNARKKMGKDLYGDDYGEYIHKFDSHPEDLKNAYDPMTWNWARSQVVNNPNAMWADEELFPYMSNSEKALFRSVEENEKAEKLADQVRGIFGETGESETSLKKALAVQKQIFGEPDPGRLMDVSRVSGLLGVQSDNSIMEGASYAAQMGFIPGTAAYQNATYQYAMTGSREGRAQLQYTSGRTSALGAQVQATMGRDGSFAGLGARLIGQYNFQNQAQVGAYTGMVQGLQQNGANLQPYDYANLASMSQQNNPYVSSVIGNMMGGFMAGGATQSEAMTIGSYVAGLGMSMQDAGVFQQMMGGNLKAYAYQAWQSGNMDNAFFDRAGRSIMQYNGATAMQVYNHWAPTVGLTNYSTAGFLGIKSPTMSPLQNEIVSSFDKGGIVGLQMLAADKSYAASMASIGIQLKGIALQENFNWGANAGGTWNNPTAGSSWGIENRQIAMQDASARANFADQWQRMTLQNDFFVRREQNQYARMQANQNYQNWQMGFNYNQQIQSQQWAQQDWQYQDTMRGLSFGWQMQDLNESIRFASGRERRSLIRQRDRAALSHNVEDEQIETTRDRQKQIWAQQEEQFQKQKQYNQELQRLDEDSFNQGKEQRETFYKLDVQGYERRLKEYEEEKKLQDELRNLQRKFQYDQLQLQKEAAGAQAAAAAAQYEINKAIAEGQKNWETLTGTIGEMNTFNNAYRIANATKEMVRMMDSVNVSRINKIVEVIRALGTVNTHNLAQFGDEP